MTSSSQSSTSSPAFIEAEELKDLLAKDQGEWLCALAKH